MFNTISDLIIGGDPATHLLQAPFAFDITLTKVQCDACCTMVGLGSLVASGGRSEAIVRCSNCGNELIRAVRTREGHLLELSGVRHLRF
ncbi:DUF6510 family protein [uncultured Bradyrhizobium sp.]|jgi:ribosomal protein S27E|uniref:DUF6510 family protein n=1 Tax=uncultured Bradyrhizobium sp. TaxID=199684 RepID=UPI0026238863|nr:DUF6510 family protein [uncultured Bradyrhizobium sp.]